MTSSIDAGMVAILRNHAPRISLLGIEVLLLCCERPRTIPELCQLTGLEKGAVWKALKQTTLFWNTQRQQMESPQLYLLQRRKRPKPEQGYRYHPTATTKKLLAGGFR